MDLILAYLAGLATLLNPCVLPILPLVAAAALQEDRRAPLWIALGLATASTLLGFALAVLGRIAGFSAQDFASFGGVALMIFGALMLLPQRLSPFRLLAPVAGPAADRSARLTGSAPAHFASGAALGLAWSPCIGPTMGAAVALASTGQSLLWSFLIMAAYGAGLVTLMGLLAYGGRAVIQRRKARLARLAQIAPKVMGATLIVMGLILTFHLHVAAEIWLLDHLPDSLLSLSTRF